MRHLGRLGGQGVIVEGDGGVRIVGQIELVEPTELEASLGNRIVTIHRVRVVLGDVCGVAGDLVGDHALLHIILVRQAEVFLRGHVAQHSGAVTTDLGGADGGGDVVVTRSGIGGQRSEGVERGALAHGLLQLDVHAHGVERHVARALDHHLHVLGPGALGQLAQSHELGKLRGVVRVGQGAGAQAIAQRERHVVLGEDVAQLVEVRVQEALLVVAQAPVGHDGATAGDDAGHAVGGQRHVTQQHAGVDGHVIHTLLALFDHGVAEQFPAQLGGIILDLFEGLVHRHGADRHGGVAQNPLTGGVDVVTGGQVHHGIGAPLGGPRQLLHFLVDGGGDGRVAHVGVELGQEGGSDNHRLGLGVVDVAGHHRAAGGQLGAHELHIAVLAGGHVLHLRGDDAVAGVPHLGDRVVLGAHRLMLASTPFLGGAAALDGALTIILKVAAAALVVFDVAAVADPVETQGLQTFLRVALGAFGVVVVERRVRAHAGRVAQLDFGVRHFQVVGTILIGERYGLGLADVRLVALLGTTGGDVHALLLGELLRVLGLLGVGELLFGVFAAGCGGAFLGGLGVGGGGVGHNARRVAVLLVTANGLPAFDHGARGPFRVLGAGDGGDREPAGGLGAGEHGHIGCGHAAAHDHREFAGSADGVDLGGVQCLAGAVVAAHGSLGLGGGDVQRAGANVVDAAVGQLVDELNEAFGLSRQTHDGLVAEQGAGFSRLHVGLADMHTVHLDALAAGLPHHVGTVVDHKGHGIGLLIVLDDLRDVAGHVGQLRGIGLLGAQLDEGCAAAQSLIHHVGQRTAFAVLRPHHEVRGQVEVVSHGGVWVFITHYYSYLCCFLWKSYWEKLL